MTNSGAHPYRLFISSLPDAVLLTDMVGQCVDANGRALELLGYEREELVGRLVTTVIPSWTPLVDRSWRNAEINQKNGTCAPVHIWATELPKTVETDGIVAAFLRPAGDRKEEDAAWVRMATIVTSSSEAIMSTTLDGVITSWNPAAEQLYGYATAEAIGQSVSMLTPPELSDELVEILARVRGGESVKGYETIRLTRDGRRIDVAVTISPVRDASGQVVSCSSIARDITDFRRQQQEMARLAAIVESPDDAIIGKSLDGTITSWNPAAERLYGYRADEALGQSIAMLAPPGGHDELPDLLVRVSRGEHVKGYEARRQTIDGRILAVALTISPIVNSDGQIIGASAIGRDVTELRQLQDERDRLHTELTGEFTRAGEIQAQLLPHDAPEVAGYEFAGICLPARQVGGDFFDWTANHASVYLSLGDVMGKGMPASLLTAMARAALRSVTHLPVSAAVEAVNRALSPDLLKSNSFITLFYANLDTESGALTYIDAGHGMAFIQRRDGGIEPLRQHGLPLGVLPDAAYLEGRTTLEPGDTLVVYSDGLPDTRPELRLDAVGVAGQIVELPDAQAKLERLVSLVSDIQTRPDDLTLVLLRREEMVAVVDAPVLLARGSSSR